MSDILPVGVQDILYGGQSELRTGSEISTASHGHREQEADLSGFR